MNLQRILNIRLMGKSMFIDTQFNQQLYINSTYKDWELALTLQRGDIIDIKSQEQFITKTGHLSYRLLDFEINKRIESSDLLPLLVHNDNLSEDTRRNNRVLDLITNQHSFNQLKSRFLLTQTIRNYLNSCNALEVETSILQSIYGGATADPFITMLNHNKTNKFLRISPELYLKKLIVSGFDFIYEIAKCFRNEGEDRTHNPEFTLLEIYKKGETVTWGIDFTIQLLNNVLNEDLQPLCFNYLDIVKEHQSELNVEETFNKYEHTYVSKSKCVVIKNHPIEISPLAYSSDGIVADRFELYINGMEIANGYTEQNDKEKQLKAMQELNNVDESYIQALSYGLPTTCGIGIGIDRLAMLVNNCSIKDIISFIK